MYPCIFNHFTQSAKKATEFSQITHPLGLLRRSRSFKVTEFGTNRKPICDFLLVINSNLPPILHRFRDIASKRSKIATFFYPGFLQVRENWKRSGKVRENAKMIGKSGKFWEQFYFFCTVVMLIRVELESNAPYSSSSSRVK